MFADSHFTRGDEERRPSRVRLSKRIQETSSYLGKKDLGYTCFVSTNANVFTVSRLGSANLPC
jgi:hypothetical protein